MTLTYADELSLLEERDALVDALVAAQDRLSALVALMRVSSDTLDLDELTLRMLEEAVELTESDAVVLSCDQGRPNQRAAHTVVGIESLQRVLDEQLRTMQLGPGSGYGMSWTVVPFPSYPKVGIAVGRLRGPAYTTGDVRMLHTVALAVEQLSVMSRLHQEVVRQATVEKEHQLASRLAQAVLPSVHPQLPGVDFFARCSPAALTGGDFMVLDEVDGVLWVAVGDVAGKGLPAAMIMTQAVAAVRVALRKADPDDPAAALAEMGAELGGYLCSVESFLTLAVAAHRPGSGTVALSNAGHSPVVYVAGAGEAPRSIGPSSPPLGVIVPRPPRTVLLPLPPGAALIIGTDGLVEQPDPAGEMLGYDVFLDTCATPMERADVLGEQLFRLVDQHADGTPAADDRTLVVLRAADPSTMADVSTASLDLEADLAELRRLGPWLGELLAATGLDERQGSLELALHEICVNVVTHAYADGPGRIALRSRVDAEAIEFEIRDTGAEVFDPDDAAEPDPDTPQIHGYGLMIVRRLVDELRYTREEGTNVWLLRTHR